MENTGFSMFYSARKAIVSHVKGGNPLIVATVLALLVANLPVVRDYYFELWNYEIKLQIGDFNLFSHGFYQRCADGCFLFHHRS